MRVDELDRLVVVGEIREICGSGELKKFGALLIGGARAGKPESDNFTRRAAVDSRHYRWKEIQAPAVVEADKFAGHIYIAKPLTVAWRSMLLPARCFTSTVS
jgi:hypothetical protein